jgi:tRNA threonylcarbamoyladenosine biosynthesis protein TsaE
MPTAWKPSSRPQSLMRALKLSDAAATLRLGEALAAGAAPGRVLFISGDLGAGKTTLVRGLLRGLGYAGRAKSPTYALVEPYSFSSLDLYHFDFYRFKDRSEWLNSGFREHFNPQSLCVVEWPEKAGDLLSPPDLHIKLEFDGEARAATLEARSPAGESWLSSLRFS